MNNIRSLVKRHVTFEPRGKKQVSVSIQGRKMSLQNVSRTSLARQHLGFAAAVKRQANRYRANLPLISDPKKAAKAIFKSVVKDGENPSEEQFDENEEEDAALLSFLPRKIQSEFKRRWRELASKQVYNGAFLEFQGMRFANSSARVYDAERNTTDDGKAVFRHIVDPVPEGRERVYLKCRFSLSDVNNDHEPVSGPGSPMWKNLEGKGAHHVEPDVIVRSGNLIRIFELKMGQGKKESGTHPKECHQLMRCKRLFEHWAAEEGIDLPEIKLYFVGWAAPTNEAVVFANSPYTSENYSVRKINSEGMAKVTKINARLVTAIVHELDRKRIIAYNRLVEQFVKPYGKYYEEYRKSVNESKSYIASVKNKYGEAINAPIRTLPIKGAGRGGAGGENQRKRARNVMQNNSNNEGTTNTTRVRRIQYNLAKAGLDPEEVQSTMRSVKAGMESRKKKARTIVQNDPEVKRLQAQLAEVRKQNSQSNNNVGLGF